MANKNDERILQLKQEIASRKEQLGTQPRPAMMTTCILEMDGKTYNLNVVHKNDLVKLLLELNMYVISAESFKTIDVDSITISGYSIKDWMSDISSKLAVLDWKIEKTKLDQLEKQLTKLLSEDKQTELAIDDLAAMLQ